MLEGFIWWKSGVSWLPTNSSEAPLPNFLVAGRIQLLKVVGLMSSAPRSQPCGPLYNSWLVSDQLRVSLMLPVFLLLPLVIDLF